MLSSKRKSSVDVVSPAGLCLAGTVTAGFQNRSHLIQAREQVAARHEPGDTLGARRCGQAAIVCPVLIEFADAVNSQLEVEIQRLFGLCLVPVNHGSRKLLNEAGVAGTRLHADAEDCRWVALCISVYKMKFSFGAVCGYGVFGRGVDVPTSEVKGCVVVCEAGQGGVVAFIVRESEGWTEAPVVEVAFEVAAVVEGWLA